MNVELLKRDAAPARLNPDAKLELLRKMGRIRRVEEQVERLNRSGRIPGFLHTSIGQEAVAVGICEALEPGDYLLSTHRGHGHLLAKGGDLRQMMCELYGKASGQNKGKGGSMHVSDFSANMLGANGIVGASLTIGVGVALSAKLQRSGHVSVTFCGEGATTNGAFHEALTLASVLSVPVIFVCENNLYAHEASASSILPIADVGARGPSYGIKSWIVDGNNVLAVLGTAQEAVAVARDASKPVLIEAKTYRQRGHHGGDSGRHYRPAEEIEDWMARDPMKRLSSELRSDGVDEATIEALLAAVAAEVDEAIAFAEKADYPDPREAFTDLYAEDGEVDA